MIETQEDTVKQALKSLDWLALQQHLDSLKVDDDVAQELPGHVRRTTDFLLKWPDPKREILRASFIETLGN